MSDHALVLNEAGTLGWSAGLGTTTAAGEPWTEAIAENIGGELAMMQDALGEQSDPDVFMAVEEWARSTLQRISELVALGLIQPAGVQQPHVLGGRPLRLGVFPTAANPLHWAHLLSGLAAMERFQLDKVIFVIAGNDPRKPDLASANLRHRIAQEVLRLFRPLFDYSPIALGSSLPGEANVFRIMASHGRRPLHAFYLAGSDHCHRFVAQTGHPDTIQRLEEGVRKGIHGFDSRVHFLSVVFLDRGDHSESVESFLDVRWIEQMPLKTSSTRIRGALSGQEPLCELAALPFTAYCALCAHDTYQMQKKSKDRPAAKCAYARRGGPEEDL
jgi:nicotinic acid mononucleotide adenylyltransferase